MAKIQTRRTVSISKVMYAAIVERAAKLGISASQYVHDLAAADLRAVGIEPPEHVSVREAARRLTDVAAAAGRASWRDPERAAHAARARDGKFAEAGADHGRGGAVDTSGVQLPASTPIARMRAAAAQGAGVVTPFRTKVFDRESEEVIEAKLNGRKLPKMTRACVWCEEQFTRIRPNIEGMHADCAVERQRVESRSAARRAM